MPASGVGGHFPEPGARRISGTSLVAGSPRCKASRCLLPPTRHPPPAADGATGAASAWASCGLCWARRRPGVSTNGTPRRPGVPRPMWIVRLALRRPYTVAVLSALILIGGILSASRLRTDIFPSIDIPVVIVVWNYPGLSAEDMERRGVLLSERAYSTTIDGITHIESQSILGVGLLKLYFEPDADLGTAIAQISAVSLTASRIMPPGISPPNILRFNAGNVPVSQITVSSATAGEQQLFDYGLNFLRVRLFTI